MRQVNLLIVALSVAVLTLGCTLATDFDEGKLEENGCDPYRLSEEIEDGTVEVTIQGNGNAVLSLALDNPICGTEELKEADLDDEKLAALLGTEIGLVVTNEETGVTANLMDGERTDSTPTAQGQYQISINSDRNQIDIVFRNETKNSLTLHEGGDYLASIEVSEIASFFTSEVITLDVVVSNAP